jgi:protein phosphatase PTC7
VIEHHEPVKVVASGLAIPHPDKVKKGAKGANSKGFGHGGEDAYFFTQGKVRQGSMLVSFVQL